MYEKIIGKIELPKFENYPYSVLLAADPYDEFRKISHETFHQIIDAPLYIFGAIYDDDDRLIGIYAHCSGPSYQQVNWNPARRISLPSKCVGIFEAGVRCQNWAGDRNKFDNAFTSVITQRVHTHTESQKEQENETLAQYFARLESINAPVFIENIGIVLPNTGYNSAVIDAGEYRGSYCGVRILLD